MPSPKRARKGKQGKENQCRDANCNGACSPQHPLTPPQVMWTNGFGTLAVLANTVGSFYCCDSKAHLDQALSEIDNKNAQILQMCETNQKLLTTHQSVMQSANAAAQSAEDKLAELERLHTEEKNEWRKERRAIVARESRAVAAAKKAKAELEDAKVSGRLRPATGQPGGSGDRSCNVNNDSVP